MNDYTETTETVNGVEVTVYGGTARPIPTFALPGHVTGWRKRSGASVTYAEPTCTCNRVGEAVSLPGEKGWIAYGEEGWIDRLNAANRAHVENVTAHGFMVRPAGGDRSRWADRTRYDRYGVILTLAENGVAPERIESAIEEIVSGGVFMAPTGARFELARDRAPYTREPLPIS
jgi:hypothetical protein